MCLTYSAQQLRKRKPRGTKKLWQRVGSTRPSGTEELTAEQIRVLVGVAALLCGGSGCFHILPVFIDSKLAEDETLPNLLSDSTLPWSQTAIFAGWLVGSVGLRPALEIFSKEQFLVLASVCLFASTIALVLLPGLTGGNFFVFSAIRFVTGLLFVTGPVGNVYVQECLPSSRRTQALAFIYTVYAVMCILMAIFCGSFQSLDWRWVALLFTGLPPLLAIFIGFKNPWATLVSVFESAFQKPTERQRLEESEASQVQGWMGEGASSELMTAALKLALCFLACGLGSYGLSYSAGQLSPNLYTNSVLLNAADILGYLVLLGADTLGRKTFQTASYLLASLALLLCGLLQPGSGQIVACAMAGRICLNVSFGLVYVALAEIFPESSQKMVLPLCQVFGRLGGILAPFCGTLPAVVSCPTFGFACLMAALATATLPDKLEDGER